MARPLRIDARDPRPIWSQIEEGLLDLIGSGALAPGEPLPSVRELARDLAVNPATVVRAYQRLSEAGVLAVRRGEGTFVAEAPPAASEAQRAARLAEAARRYAALGRSLGFRRKRAEAEFNDAWRSLAREGRESDE